MAPVTYATQKNTREHTRTHSHSHTDTHANRNLGKHLNLAAAAVDFRSLLLLLLLFLLWSNLNCCCCLCLVQQLEVPTPHLHVHTHTLAHSHTRGVIVADVSLMEKARRVARSVPLRCFDSVLFSCAPLAATKQHKYRTWTDTKIRLKRALPQLSASLQPVSGMYR